MADKNLKPGWKVWCFDQMAENIGERADPTPDDSELYVGLEHMDTDSLQIRRWGSKADLIGQKLKMRKGDILFARRNAYLKRVAIAPHDGLFSAHGMVLRAKREVVVPEFLPFFMQSDPFMSRAVEISVGSLSPTINWKTMAVQEFALPPTEEQRRLVEIFQCAVANIESITQTLDAARRLQARLLIDRFEVNELPQKSLDDVLERIIDYRGKSPNKTPSGVPLITARNVRDGFLDFSRAEFIPESEFDSWMTRGMPQIGDVLFTTEAPLGNVARVPNMKFALAQRLVCLRADKHKMHNDYLYWALRSPITQQRVVMRSTGTTVSGVKQSELRKVQLGVPSLDEQAEIAAQLNELEQASATLLARLEVASKIRMRLAADYL